MKIVESIPDGVNNLIDEARDTLDTITADCQLVLKVTKAMMEGSIVLSELEALLASLSKRPFSLSATYVLQFVTWLAENFVRISDFVGLAALFTAKSLTDKFDNLFDVSQLDAAVFVLESIVSTLINDITQSDVRAKGQSATLTVLRNCVSALCAQDGLQNASELECQLVFLQRISFADTVSVIDLDSAMQMVEGKPVETLKPLQQCVVRQKMLLAWARATLSERRVEMDLECQVQGLQEMFGKVEGVEFDFGTDADVRNVTHMQQAVAAVVASPNLKKSEKFAKQVKSYADKVDAIVATWIDKHYGAIFEPVICRVLAEGVSESATSIIIAPLRRECLVPPDALSALCSASQSNKGKYEQMISVGNPTHTHARTYPRTHVPTHARFGTSR